MYRVINVSTGKMILDHRLLDALLDPVQLERHLLLEGEGQGRER